MQLLHYMNPAAVVIVDFNSPLVFLLSTLSVASSIKAMPFSPTVIELPVSPLALTVYCVASPVVIALTTLIPLPSSTTVVEAAAFEST